MKKVFGRILAIVLASSMAFIPAASAYAEEFFVAGTVETEQETSMESSQPIESEIESAPNPGTITELAPELDLDRTPTLAPELESALTPELELDRMPALTPELEPTAIPALAPGLDPDGTPTLAAELESELAPELDPATMPALAPEIESDHTQELESDRTSEPDPEPLPVPFITSISNINGGVKLVWDYVESIDHYQVMRKTADTDWVQLVLTDETVYIDEAVVSGTEYFYTILCIIEDEEGNTDTFETIGNSIIYVAAPSIKSLSVGNTGITINWEQTAGTASYRVFRKKSSGGWGKLADTTALTFTDQTAAAGQSYTYTVRCLDAAGNFASAYDTAGKTITYAENPVISSVSNAFGGVKITWTGTEDAAAYRIYRRTGSASWAKLADTAARTFTDQTAVSGSNYYYTVRCLDTAGNFISGFESPGKAITYVAAPALVSAVSTFGGVTVSWGKVTGAASYRLYRKNGTAGWTRITDTGALNYTDKSTASGSTYIYTVRCLNAAGETVSSFDAAGISADYVAAPAISSAENVVSGVKVSWGKVPGAASYRLYRKSGAASWARIADTTALTFTDKNTAGGTKYSYTLRCLDEAGNIISGFDPAGKSITYVAPPVLSSISNVYGGITVSWKKTAGAAKYRLYRKSGTGTWAKIADTADLSYTDSKAVSGTKYTYTVRSLDSAGAIVSSFDSAGISITYTAAPIISGAENTAAGVKISWDKVPGAASYRLYRKSGTASWARIADTTALTYTDKTTTGGTKYSYTLRCLDEAGNIISGFHPSGKTITYLTVPKLGSVSNVYGGVQISWNKVTGASKYRLYRKAEFGNWVKIADTAALTYTDKTAYSGTTYFYTVRCLDAAGNPASSFDAAGLKIRYVAAPVIRSVTNDVGAVKITWESVNGAVGVYRVYRKTGSGSWVRVGDTRELSYRDETCTNGTKYTYTVRCLDHEGRIISSFDPVGKSITYQRKVLNVDRTNVELSNLFGVTEITVSFLYRTGDDYITFQVEEPRLVTCEWGNGWDGYDTSLRIYAGKQAGTTYITLKNTINSETIKIKVTVRDDIIQVTSGN